MSELDAEVEDAFDNGKIAAELMDARQARDNLFLMLVAAARQQGGKLTFTAAELEDTHLEQGLLFTTDMLTDSITIELYEE